MKKEASETTFATIADVLDHLQDNGWKVTKTSLYRHQNNGKIIPGDGGAYRLKDVEKYAKTWLRQQSTGKKINDRMDELQRKKLEIEIRAAELDERRKEHALQKDLGSYVLKGQMEIELATWAGIAVASLEHLVMASAAEWTRIVGGDMGKVSELIVQMKRAIKKNFNEITVAEFNVILEGEKRDPDPEETEEEDDPC